MKKSKFSITALFMLVTVVGTMAASATTRFANDCSSVPGGPLDRLSTRCDATNIFCCQKPDGTQIKGIYH